VVWLAPRARKTVYARVALVGRYRERPMSFVRLTCGLGSGAAPASPLDFT
jgi:hypothetical protein